MLVSFSFLESVRFETKNYGIIMANSQVEEPDRRCLKELPPNLIPTGEFLLDKAQRLNWGDLSNSIVMDVGCGMDSLELFKAVFPKFHKIIAIDKSLNYINYLKFYRKHENMEYRVADITNRSTLIEWEAKMSKITSFYCFNCLTDQKSGFANIHYLLQPGGEAIILTALKNPHYECAKYLLQKPKWSVYQHLEKKFTDFQAHETGIRFYENILNDLDFEIVSCVEDFRVITFATEEEFRASYLTKDRVIGVNLPINLLKEFEEEYSQALMQLNGRSSEGKFYLRTSTAQIVIRRKKI